MKFAASFSGGKDSFLSIVDMIENGNELMYIIVSSKEDGISYTHNLNREYFLNISEVLKCDVIFTDTNIINYEKSFEKALLIAKDDGVEGCIFGDIDIKEHLEWNEKRCKNVGIKCINPLNRYSREEVLKKFFELNVDAIVKKIDEKKLPKTFVGEKLSYELIGRMISECKTDNFDICGENGEYHTYIDIDSMKNWKTDYK